VTAGDFFPALGAFVSKTRKGSFKLEDKFFLTEED
jgi:hypothetical protein